MAFKLGPQAREQLARMQLVWRQGEHVLITGGTGSGKTTLARQLDQMRIDAGGSVVVFVGKLQPDATFDAEYKGWRRWKEWHKRSSLTDNKIILWPAVEGLNKRDALEEMHRVFSEALDEISKIGKWCVHIDEGLLLTDRVAGLRLGDDIAQMYQLMRSAKATLITLAQRPAHLPLSIYANLSYAYIGKVQEYADVKRLANLDGAPNSRELAKMISGNSRREFVWLPVAQGWAPERLDLAR